MAAERQKLIAILAAAGLLLLALSSLLLRTAREKSKEEIALERSFADLTRNLRLANDKFGNAFVADVSRNAAVMVITGDPEIYGAGWAWQNGGLFVRVGDENRGFSTPVQWKLDTLTVVMPNIASLTFPLEPGEAETLAEKLPDFPPDGLSFASELPRVYHQGHSAQLKALLDGLPPLKPRAATSKSPPS